MPRASTRLLASIQRSGGRRQPGRLAPAAGPAAVEAVQGGTLPLYLVSIQRVPPGLCSCCCCCPRSRCRCCRQPAHGSGGVQPRPSWRTCSAANLLVIAEAALQLAAILLVIAGAAWQLAASSSAPAAVSRTVLGSGSVSKGPRSHSISGRSRRRRSGRSTQAGGQAGGQAGWRAFEVPAG